MNNILLTSVGRRTYLVNYFKEAFDGIGKVYASNSSKSIATNAADGYLITPLIYDASYIPIILEFCLTNDIKTIISVFDIDLLVLSKNRALFAENGIKVLLAEEEFVEICNDKWKTYLFLEEQRINTPKTYLSVENVLAEIENAVINYPIIIKPRWGMASMGIFIADNEMELRVFAEKSAKEIANTYLKYESSFTPNNTLIFQEVLKGEEFGLDVINDLGGNYVTTLAKRKVLMRAGETDLGKTVSSIPFQTIAKQLSEKSRHELILSVDCFIVNNFVYVIEMNCRISGHYPISHMAGVDLPRQLVDWLVNKKKGAKYLNIKEGVFVTKDLVPVVLD